MLFRRCAALFLCLAAVGTYALADCGVGSFAPDRTYWADDGNTYWLSVDPATHSTIYLTDPANQQYAAFDMEWGGALASLRYRPAGSVYIPGQGVQADAEELVWGHDPGAMVQFALWTGNSYYNPDQAGDVGSNGSALYGAACKNLPDGTQLVLIHSSTRDFWQNNPPWGDNMNYGRAAALYGSNIFGSPGNKVNHYGFATPYAVTVTARFVPNPACPSGNCGASAPRYYLKIDSFVQRTDILETFTPFLWTYALYTPYSFTNYVMNPANCVEATPCNADTHLLVGLYPDPSLADGVAIGTNAATWASGSLVYNSAGADNNWHNQGGGPHAKDWYVASGAGRRFIVYIMAGSWSTALQYNMQ